MPPRKELCRNFQRGSCHYGDRCKFLHTTQQQSKPNPFGFGAQNSSPFQRTNQQQQAPNPFGFGVSNNTQSRGGSEFGSKPNQFKPFENKWTRDSGTQASRQPDNQTQVAKHKCTDPESCKRAIADDLKNEKPLWKLTCYGHSSDGPCDIVGDASFEELRALAYDDAKQGKSIQFIIERERSLINAKLVEFQNLLQKPYVAAPSTQNPFGGGNSSVPIMNNGVSTSATSFSQLNTSLNKSSAASPTYNFGQSTAFQNNNQPSTMFSTQNSAFHTSGSFGSQTPHQSAQNPFSFGSANSNNSSFGAPRNPFSTLPNSSLSGNMFAKPLDPVSNQPNPASNATPHPGIGAFGNVRNESTTVDDEIWRRPEWKWNAGEIPEDPPPDKYVF